MPSPPEPVHGAALPGMSVTRNGPDHDGVTSSSSSGASQDGPPSGFFRTTRSLVVVVFAVLAVAVGGYIALPPLFNEAYWITHKYHEAPARAASGAHGPVPGPGSLLDASPGASSLEVHAKRGQPSGGSGGGKGRGGGRMRSSPRASGGGGGGAAPRARARKPTSGRKGRRRFEAVGTDEARAKAPKVYGTDTTCKEHWRKMAKRMLEPWADGVNRESMNKVPWYPISSTSLWLRNVGGSLKCVLDPRIKEHAAAGNYSAKVYRARHYVQRVNAILKSGKHLPENLEWWNHHSDLSKVPKGIELVDGLPPPVFAVAGGPDFWDIPGVPFMSFTDAKSEKENAEYAEVKQSTKNFDERWAAKKSRAFFLGGLSDCANAMKNHGSDPKWCGRAKMVKYGADLAESGETDLLSGIQIYDRDPSIPKLLNGCERCVRPQLGGKAFVKELMDHKYVLNFDGAGNWSRRMSLLLRSGSVVVKAESPGYQFYEFGLEPGVHYVPFDPAVGKDDPGNLRPRLEWLAEFDDVAKELAQRAESFGDNCLSEHSINDFVYEILAEYGRLQRGRPIKYQTIDVSQCLDRKTCRGVLEPCFGFTFQRKQKGLR